MNNFLRIAILVLSWYISIQSVAQSMKVYYYKGAKQFVASDGWAQRPLNRNTYYTFMNSYGNYICYESDANGNKKGQGGTFRYRGQKDGNLWYVSTFTANGQWYWMDCFQILVSSDYSILNYIGDGWRDVYYRAKAPSPSDKIPNLVK